MAMLMENLFDRRQEVHYKSCLRFRNQNTYGVKLTSLNSMTNALDIKLATQCGSYQDSVCSPSTIRQGKRSLC